MSFEFEKTPSISLGCKVVPVHYLDCEYDHICLVSLLLNLTVYVKTKNVIQGYQIFTSLIDVTICQSIFIPLIELPGSVLPIAIRDLKSWSHHKDNLFKQNLMELIQSVALTIFFLFFLQLRRANRILLTIPVWVQSGNSFIRIL